MEKIKLEITGLSYSQTQSGAYALLLSESNGSRRLPIIIGAAEAQSIAIELENMVPSRPLTHDLFKHFAKAFDINVLEVVIYKLQEGVFYAKLICEMDGITKEIDARTSDAIAVGLRFKSPVFTYESILNSAGIQLEDQEDSEDQKHVAIETNESKKDSISSLSLEELNEKLDQALEDEDYELASKLRDEINRRNG
ncbi:MAG: bifunctional nuclease family protein [Crocinitomicaceae bacterium]|nr:bifunctional nuclease family protein [Crocinitomicaceae bacterium]